MGRSPPPGPTPRRAYGGVGASPSTYAADRRLIAYVDAHAPGIRWGVLTIASDTAAPLILMNFPATALAGYSGTDQALRRARAGALGGQPARPATSCSAAPIRRAAATAPRRPTRLACRLVPSVVWRRHPRRRASAGCSCTTAAAGRRARGRRVAQAPGRLQRIAHVFVTRPIAQPALRRLAAEHEVDTWEHDEPPPREELVRRAAAAEGLLCMLSDPIDADLLARCPRLRVISTYAVGFDNIDLAAARDRSIAVGHTPDVLTDATADLAFGLLLAAARFLGEGERAVRERPLGQLAGRLARRGRRVRHDARCDRLRQDRPGRRPPRTGLRHGRCCGRAARAGCRWPSCSRARIT